MVENLSGTTLKGYELRERVGSGGYGAVYRAYQSTVGRDVAVKIILPGYANQPEFIRRFEAEAQIVARLEHLHIAPLYDYWRDPDGAYMVMRLLRGGSLKDALRQGPFDLESAALLLDQVTSALAAAHQHNVIHRDIKPANILLDEDNNAYLADFGIARAVGFLGTEITQAESIIGSPDYLSPEQARCEPVTPRTDIYSLGIVLYEMLTGEHPFPGVTSVERIYKHINEPVPEITSLDEQVLPSVNEVIQRATAKNPKHRYAHALAMGAAFREASALSMTQIPQDVVELLTPREQQVLKLLIDGKANREIAAALTVELSTVKWYVTQIYRKLNVRSRVQAIVKARDLDLIAGPAASAGVAVTGTTALPEPENPYKGLCAFEAADEQDFFGREALTAKLIDRMQANSDRARFLAVVGPSGSGKSSLIKAGLVPALWRGELPGSDKWFVIQMMPGPRPLDELEVALLRVTANRPDMLREQLERDAFGLIRAAQIILPDDKSELVVVIDQLEEVFTLVEDEEARRHFLDLLCTAVTDTRSRVRVVVTLRADFYDRPLQYPGFGELVRSYLETVLPLSAEELERAIVRPAQRVAVEFEEGLVASVIEEVHYQPGALPLLQYALTELFERREGRLLTHEAYQAMGRAVGALAKRADEIFLGLDKTGQEIVRQMFLRLVTLGEGVEDTRRRVACSELMNISDDEDLVEELIDTYARYRLLSLDNDPATRSPTVEVAHEAILREWERLRQWLKEARDDIKRQRQLTTATRDWEDAGREASFLLSGSRLEQFETWAAETGLALTARERNFLNISVAEHERLMAQEQERQRREEALALRARNRLRLLVVVLGVATLIGSGLTVFAFAQNRKVQRVADMNHSLALAANAEREYESGYTDLATALVLEATRIDEPPTEAIRALAEIAQAPATRYVLDGHEAGAVVITLSFSPDGQLAVSGGSDGSLILWDTVRGEEVHRLTGHSGPVWNVAFSPDGKTMASTAGSLNAPEDVILWDLELGTVIRRFQAGEFVGSLAFSPDGRLLLTGPGGDWMANPQPLKGTSLEPTSLDITLWEVETGQVVRRFALQTAAVTSLAFTPDGKAFVSGSYDDVGIRLWNLETGEVIRSFVGHTPDSGVTTGVFALVSPDGSTILSAGDYTLRLWDIETGEELRSHLFGTEPYALSLGSGGQVASYTNALSGNWALWDVANWRLAQQFSDLGTTIISATAISPDGRQALSASPDGIIRVWDLGSHDEVRRLGDDTPLFAAAFSPDGERLLTGDMSGTVTMWDIETGLELRRFEDNFGVILEAVFSPNGQYVAVAAGDYLGEATSGSLILWDAETGRRVHDFEGHTHLLRSLAFSPDGRTLLAGSQVALANTSTDGDLILWDVMTGELIRRFDTTEDITGIAFTADGRQAVTSSAYSRNVTVWDVATGRSVNRFEGHTGDLFDLALSPDEQTVLTASSDKSLVLWNLADGEVLHRFVGHEAPVWSADISPDGRLALSSGEDGLVILWDLTTGQELRRFAGHATSAWVPTTTFSPDGQTAFSVGLDGAAIQWQIAQPPLDELIAWTLANRYIREFTCEERAQYLIEPLCGSSTDAP
jgi:WD40 repeat protein/serine/threonine protein kinase